MKVKELVQVIGKGTNLKVHIPFEHDSIAPDKPTDLLNKYGEYDVYEIHWCNNWRLYVTIMESEEK